MTKRKSKLSKIWDELNKWSLKIWNELNKCKIWTDFKNLKRIDIGINICVSSLVIYLAINILNNIDYEKAKKLFEDVSQYFSGREVGLLFVIGMSLILCSLYVFKRHNEWLKFIVLFWMTLIIFGLRLEKCGINLSDFSNHLFYVIYTILLCLLSFIIILCVFSINKYFSSLNKTEITKVTDTKEITLYEQNNRVDNIRISKFDNYDKIAGIAFKSLCLSLILGVLSIIGVLFIIIIDFISVSRLF